MEGILNKLIVPDNDSIKEGTKELREALKTANAVPELCSVIGSSPYPHNRKLAAIILKKKLCKHRYWLNLPLDTRQFVKQGLIQSLVNDQEKSVKTAVGQVIAVLTRHEIPENGWPELKQFIQQMTTSDNINDKELGLFTLQILTDIASDQFVAHAHSFVTLFNNILCGLQDQASNLAYLTLLCMINFVPAIEGDQIMVNAYHEMMPRVMAVVKEMAKKRPDKTVEVLFLVDELADHAISVIVPHLRLIMETCMELCLDSKCGEDLQIKALNIIGTLVETKKKQIVKLKLVEPILDVLFRLMCTPMEDEEANDFPDLEENHTVSTVANQTLDILALHLPPDKLLQPLMEKYIFPNIRNNDAYVRKAVYLAMAVVVEGCADYIQQRHMPDLISYIKTGLSDPVPIVSNAALFALGQFSEHLQPKISVFASDIIPILLEHLKDVLQKEENSQKVDRMFYALESFCESLNESILPFLSLLMNYLIPLLSPPHSINLRRLTICTVGACANAAQEEMITYFPGIMNSLKEYLTEVQASETLCLQVQSVDTLGILARTVGNENFMPMARETMELGIQLINNTDDPDLRKSLYGLFAAVSTVLKDHMSPYMPVIIERILKSIKSDGGLVLHKDENNPTMGLFEDLSDTEESEEDLGNTSDVSSDKGDSEDGFTVENAYLEEKEQAIVAVRELAQNCLEVFGPYVDVCFQEIFSLINYPHEDIRSVSLTTVTQLCIHWHKVSTARHTLLSALRVLVPKCAEVVRTDKERGVVISGLDTYLELLKEVGAPVLEGEGHCDAIINCVLEVLNFKTECQDDGDGQVEEGEEEAEGDELLLESAGEIVPHLGKVMPPQQFSECYTQFLTIFSDFTKRHRSDSMRSFSVGMIAECMSSASPCLPSKGSFILSLLIPLIQDQNDEVRNNAIFALGELAYHGRETIFPFYGDILQILSIAVVNERNSGVLDNICGALARLIITNVSLVPLEQVVPVFVRYLPLREDYEENKWVYQSLSLLYQMGSSPLLQNLNPGIKACAFTLHGNQIENENRHLILNLLKSIHQDFPSECSKAAQELPESVASTLKQACVA